MYDTDKMIFVKGGKFNFGSDNGLDREKPEREVIIQSFLIDKNPMNHILLVNMRLSFFPKHLLNKLDSYYCQAHATFNWFLSFR